jgi:hypothetical protein
MLLLLSFSTDVFVMFGVPDSDISLQNLGDMIFQYIIGSIILATLAGSLMFLVSYALLSKVRKSLKN